MLRKRSQCFSRATALKARLAIAIDELLLALWRLDYQAVNFSGDFDLTG